MIYDGDYEGRYPNQDVEPDIDFEPEPDPPSWAKIALWTVLVGLCVLVWIGVYDIIQWIF